jgi:murein DD-endopeptidase MepM/ murein hydrolase activator NlpD
VKSTYAATFAVLVVAMPAIILLLLGGGMSATTPASCGRSGALAPAVETEAGLDADQMEVARQIVASARAFPETADKPHAAVIALATARQESGIRNLGYGDRDSLGAFQQRPSQGWGTPAEVMDVAYATTSFLRRLVQVRHWESRRVTDVAAEVQRPAEEYRELYEQWVPLAAELVDRLWPSTLAAATTGAADCISLVSGGGDVAYPVPWDSRPSDSRNWGGGGSRWSTWHTGTDFAVPCGTPVVAATSGTVAIEGGEAWAGRWLVKVVTGPASVATWYAHMRAVIVSDGQRVSAGQQIGEVGDLGNATGCHLHFEVHLRNGSIYGPDNTDPSRWLAAAAVTPAGHEASNQLARGPLRRSAEG